MFTSEMNTEALYQTSVCQSARDNRCDSFTHALNRWSNQEASARTGPFPLNRDSPDEPRLCYSEESVQ